MMHVPLLGHHPKCYSVDNKCYCASGQPLQLPPENAYQAKYAGHDIKCFLYDDKCYCVSKQPYHLPPPSAAPPQGPQQQQQQQMKPYVPPAQVSSQPMHDPRQAQALGGRPPGMIDPRQAQAMAAGLRPPGTVDPRQAQAMAAGGRPPGMVDPRQAQAMAAGGVPQRMMDPRQAQAMAAAGGHPGMMDPRQAQAMAAGGRPPGMVDPRQAQAMAAAGGHPGMMDPRLAQAMAAGVRPPGMVDPRQLQAMAAGGLPPRMMDPRLAQAMAAGGGHPGMMDPRLAQAMAAGGGHPGMMDPRLAQAMAAGSGHPRMMDPRLAQAIAAGGGPPSMVDMKQTQANAVSDSSKMVDPKQTQAIATGGGAPTGIADNQQCQAVVVAGNPPSPGQTAGVPPKMVDPGNIQAMAAKVIVADPSQAQAMNAGGSEKANSSMDSKEIHHIPKEVPPNLVDPQHPLHTPTSAAMSHNADPRLTQAVAASRVQQPQDVSQTDGMMKTGIHQSQQFSQQQIPHVEGNPSLAQIMALKGIQLSQPGSPGKIDPRLAQLLASRNGQQSNSLQVPPGCAEKAEKSTHEMQNIDDAGCDELSRSEQNSPRETTDLQPEDTQPGEKKRPTNPDLSLQSLSLGTDEEKLSVMQTSGPLSDVARENCCKA